MGLKPDDGLEAICEWCGRQSDTVCTVHQNTAYHDAASNLFTGCSDCREENEKYWAGMWAEYYGSVI